MDGRIKWEQRIENVNVDPGNNTGLIIRVKNGLKNVQYQDVTMQQHWEHMCIIPMLAEKKLFRHATAVIKRRENFR